MPSSLVYLKDLGSADRVLKVREAFSRDESQRPSLDDCSPPLTEVFENQFPKLCGTERFVQNSDQAEAF